MTINRRQALVYTGACVMSAAGVVNVLAADSPAIASLSKSELIYLTPFLADGRESTCHAEVWFVHHNEEIFVVTKSDAWRTEAIRRGLNRAGIWIGEFGVWKRAKDSFRSAPYLVIEGRLDNDTDMQASVLDVFGAKYAAEWGTWGPRFREGLAEGSRVMLRYTIVS